jgi:hypothetical protein
MPAEQSARTWQVLALTDVSRHCTIPAAAPQQPDVTPILWLMQFACPGDNQGD